MMEPETMKRRPEHRTNDPGVDMSDRRLERMATPLTVLHANIQLLQRRVRNGNVPDPDGLLRVLDKLEQASRTISDEIRELRAEISPGQSTHAKMEQDRSSVVHDEEERDI